MLENSTARRYKQGAKSGRWGEVLRPTACKRDRGLTHRGAVLLCAEHVRQLGGASPLHNLMEVKCQRSARASPRGGVRRKHGAKPRPDEQKPDTRQPGSDERTTDREVPIHQGPVVVDPAGAR